MFFENMVAQELISPGHVLIVTEFKTKGSTSVYEVDFILLRLDKDL